jgi:hypothetical protein
MQGSEVIAESTVDGTSPDLLTRQGNAANPKLDAKKKGVGDLSIRSQFNRGDGVNLTRTSSRVPVTGWANVRSDRWDIKGARLHDISEVGVSIYLQVQLELHLEYQIQLSVYRNGKVHNVNARGDCLHSTLVGLHGFRHGFIFHLINDGDQIELQEILS